MTPPAAPASPFLSLTQLPVSGVKGVLGSCGYASLDWDEGRNGSVSGELESTSRAALAGAGEEEWLNTFKFKLIVFVAVMMSDSETATGTHTLSKVK